MKKVFALIMAVAMVFALVACSAASSATVAPAQEAAPAKAEAAPDKAEVAPAETAPTTEAAPAEETSAEIKPEDVTGDLMIYTSAAEAFISVVVEKFNAAYPNAHAEYFRSGTEEVISKLNAENMTNSIQADVIMVSDGPTFESLKEQNLLQTYVYPEKDNLYTDFDDPEGYYYGTFPGCMGIIYNTNLVSEAPTSWWDLTKEANKNNVIMPNPLYSGTAANMLLEFLQADNMGWDFYNGLQANDVMIVNGNGGVISSVTAGEKAYGICFDADAYTAKQSGSPVDFIYPSEGSPATADPIGILASAKNLTAAQAFVNFMLSDEIQTYGRDANGRTPGVKSVPVLEGRIPLDDRTIMIHDAKVLYKSREEAKEKFAEMFGF